MRDGAAGQPAAGGVLPVGAIESACELRSAGLFARKMGFWLLAVLNLRVIVGAWKKKTVENGQEQETLAGISGQPSAETNHEG